MARLLRDSRGARALGDNVTVGNALVLALHPLVDGRPSQDHGLLGLCLLRREGKGRTLVATVREEDVGRVGRGGGRRAVELAHGGRLPERADQTVNHCFESDVVKGVKVRVGCVASTVAQIGIPFAFASVASPLFAKES